MQSSNIYIFLILISLISTLESKKQIWIRKFQMCDKKHNYPIKISGNFQTKSGTQFANLTAEVNTPFGQDQNLNATFDFSTNGQDYILLFKFSRSNLCDFFNKDLGPFWFEIQRQIAVPIRQCPIPIGRYNVRNYELPYQKLQLPLPSGFIRSILNIVDAKNNQIVTCLLSVIEITQ